MLDERERLEAGRRQVRLRRQRRTVALTALVVLAVLAATVLGYQMWRRPLPRVPLAADEPLALGTSAWFVSGENRWTVVESGDRPGTEALARATWTNPGSRDASELFAPQVLRQTDGAVGYAVFASADAQRVALRVNGRIRKVQLHPLTSVPGWQLAVWRQPLQRPGGDEFAFAYYDADGNEILRVG